MRKIQIPTSDGIKEYPFIPDGAEYDRAMAAGEIAAGMDIVYKQYLVHLHQSGEMILLENVMPAGPAGMGGFSFVPDIGQWQQSPDGMQWSFTTGGGNQGK